MNIEFLNKCLSIEDVESGITRVIPFEQIAFVEKRIQSGGEIFLNICLKNSDIKPIPYSLDAQEAIKIFDMITAIINR